MIDAANLPMNVLDPAASPIGVGLAALGRPAYINLGRGHDLGEDRSRAELARRAHAVLDAAWDAGVRYFDAARSYGLAEEFLSSWLAGRDLAGDSPVIGSKWGYTYTGRWRMDESVQESKDLSAATFRRQLAETRDLLGDRLSLFQIHSATIESGVLDDDDLLAELAALRSSGVAVGVSVTGAGQAETIDRALELGLFDTVQATWNLLERSAAPALQRAHDAGLGVIVKEVVANGRLTVHGAEPALLAYARDHALPPDAVAIAAAISQPWSDVVLSGAVNPEMLASNLRARELLVGGARPADELSKLCVDPDAYWQRRSRLPWR
jgi:aryl-alcohol dehydrogenase-like predicted oxidoreductase